MSTALDSYDTPAASVPDVRAALVSAIERIDGLSAVLAEMASSSGRLSPGALDAAVVWDQQTADDLYRANPYAATIVDRIVDDAMRKGFDVTVSEAGDDDEGDADAHPFDDYLAGLGFSGCLARADKMARLIGRAGIYVGVDDGRDPSQPVNVAAVRRITHLSVVEGWYLRPRTWQSDFRLPGFGDPLTYDIQPQAPGGSVESIVTVHASRLIVLDGRWLPSRLRQYNDADAGDSVLQAAWRRVQDLSRADKDLGIILRSFSQAVLKVAGLADLVSAGNADAVNTRIRLMNASLGALGMSVLSAEGGEDLTYSTRSVAGLPEVYDRIAQSVASAAGMPLTVLFGQAPGGLSTDDAAGTRHWDDQVQSHQTVVLTPAVERMVDLVSLAADGPTDGQAIEYSVVWRPLRQPTEREAAEVRKMQAEIDGMYWDREILTTEEIRESRFGGPAYSADTTLHAEDDDDVEGAEFGPEDIEPPAPPGERDDAARYSDIDFQPPEGAAAEAQRGLAWRDEHGRGGTQIGAARARDLAGRRNLSPETVRRMKAFFDRHAGNLEADGAKPGEPGYPSAGRIAWALWGGDAGRRWAERIVRQMEAADAAQGV